MPYFDMNVYMASLNHRTFGKKKLCLAASIENIKKERQRLHLRSVQDPDRVGYNGIRS
jgi:hypothetical protein